MKRRHLRCARPLEAAAGKAPTAFRIWVANSNPTDHGETIFSERSAKVLMEEQEKRGNLYSIDYDHLSLTENRPATAGQAAGWHRLEVRPSPAGPELWAVDVEWCDEAREGIEAKPPKWRYFSPAYDIDEETREVISYLNTALCINPATWHNNQLASRLPYQRGNMKSTEKLAVMRHLKSVMSSEDKEAAQHAAALHAAMGGEDEHKKLEAEEAKRAAETETKKETEDDAPESKPEPGKGEEEGGDEGKEPPAKSTKASKKDERPETPYGVKASVQLASRVVALESELHAIKVERLLASRTDLPASVREWAQAQKPEVVASFLKANPAATTQRPKVTATRGDTQGTEEAAIDPTIGAKVDAILGRLSDLKGTPGMGRPVTEAGENQGVRQLNSATPAQIRAARRGGKAA